MAITFGQAKLQLAQFAGRAGLCPDDPEVDLFVKEVLQGLLFKGPESSLRAYCFQVRAGCITVPYELETINKVQVDDRPGEAWSMWFKYHDQGFLNGKCMPFSDAMSEEANRYPTAYMVPAGGSQIGVMGICEEDLDAHVLVKGVDPTGREIFTVHDGEQVSGEYLSIKRGQIRVTTAKFARIDYVIKTKTKGYVTLLAVNPEVGSRKFLSDYSPLEEIPQYRRYRLTVRCRENAIVNVLGRVRLRENYADSDVIPVENISALKTAAQGIQLRLNTNYELAVAADKVVGGLLTEENQYKKDGSSTPINVHFATSPGTIRNVLNPFRRTFRGWWGQ